MKYAIIAAGEGSRLAEEGIAEPKPMVTLGGVPLIDRLIRVFLAHGAESVCVVCNACQQATIRHLQSLALPQLRVMARQTPSSMHSLYELSPWLQGDAFVLTTVDTIFRESEFSEYVTRFSRLLATGEADGLMGVTDFIDDEKPLYVKTDETSGLISSFLDADDCPRYISAGIYGLSPRALITLQACIERGESRMRNFQRALIRDGLRLQAFPFTQVFDIDHAADIVKAEAFIGQ
jgi:NDP-sugar pyrophosphorylase family protein